MEKNEFYLLCDESGRLGYSDGQENCCGEITVVAGMLINSSAMGFFSEFVESLVHKYIEHDFSSQKFHITDLSEDISGKLREELFSFIALHNIPVAYGGIYYAALSREFNKQKVINEKMVKSAKSNGVGVSGNLSKFKKLSQSESFYYFYAKVVCALIQKTDQPVNINVITDKVDNKTLKSYQMQIDRLHNRCLSKPLIGNRYFYKTKEIEKFSVSVKIESKDPKDLLLKFSTGKITKEKDVVHPIAADIVANSVHYYLKEYVKCSEYGPLNCYKAIKNHPLVKQFICVESMAMDRLYPYVT